MTGQPSTEAITAVFELRGGDPEGRAIAIAVEQSHELPPELGPVHAREESLARVLTVDRRGDGIAVATIEFPPDLAGGELSQLLVLLLGNVSLQDGIRLIDVVIPTSLIEAVGGGPRLGVAGVRRLIDAPTRALLAAAIKPVGSTAAELAEAAYRMALGGIDVVKEDQGLADQRWAPFAERVPRIAEAVARANAETGRRSLYLPCVSAPGARFRERVLAARDAGADGLLLLPGINGFDRIQEAAGLLEREAVLLQHPSFLGGFTAGATHGISPEVLFGTLSRIAGADAVIFPSWGGRFSLTREQCVGLAERLAAPLDGVATALPAPGGGMSIERVPELLDAYGDDVLLLMGTDLYRAEDLRAGAERFRAAVER